MNAPATHHVLNSFTDIPISDINLLLSRNNIAIPADNTQAYQLAKQLLLTSNLPSVPSTSFIDFIIALHISRNFAVSRYNLSDIQNVNDEQLTPLANAFGLNTIDRNRIIRILKFLGGLNSDVTLFEQVPTELLLQTLRYADCQTISRTCESSPQFQRVCNSNEVLSLMKRAVTERTGMVTDNLDFNRLNQMCKFAPTKNISAGGNHSLVLIRQGQVYSFGSNVSGELGLGDRRIRNRPTLIPNLNNITQISAGLNTSMIVTSDGHVYAFGSNLSDELGLPEGPFDNPEDLPLLVNGLNNIISISTNHLHTLALGSNGQVYGFGHNHHGKLGLGRNVYRSHPVLIPGLNDIIQVSAGYDHSLALTTNGQVYGVGYNFHGQLGLNPNRKEIYSFILIPGLNNIVSVAAGYIHSLALNSSGQLFIFGSTIYTPIGKGTVIKSSTTIPILNGIVSISTKDKFSLALTETGQVYSFGSNLYGQLGQSGISNVTDDIPTLIPGLNNITQISAGYNHSLVVDNEGNIYAFGNNSSGQLGLGDPLNRNVPTLISNFHI